MRDEIHAEALGSLNYEELGAIMEDYPSKKVIHKNKYIDRIFGVKKGPLKYSNTDSFFYNIYEYYYCGGYTSIVLSNVTEIFSLIFGVIFIGFLSIFLDWNRLLECGTNSEIKDCGELYLYMNPQIPNPFIILVLFSTLIFTLCKILIFIYNYTNLNNTLNFYKNVLKISDHEIHTYSWHKIVTELSQIKPEDNSICNITNKILRKENYFVALIHKDIIEIPSNILYTKQLDFNLRYIILNDIDNLNADTLKKKFVLYGIINLLFSIIIFIYLSCYFFVSNIDESYSNKDVLGSRRYSVFAKWKFRDYNELKHFFEKRTNKSVVLGNEYVKNFPSPVTEIIGKFIGLLCGAFIGFFLVLSILDESILLYVHIHDRSLLFYMGIIGAISSFARGLVRTPENSIYNPSVVMQKLCKYTHYNPRDWKDKTHTYKVRNEFLQFFPYMFTTFLYELLSVITTPYILLFIMPKQSSKIYNFIKINTIKTENMGNICRFADFDSKDKSKDKKMEQSISYFAENNSEEYDSQFLF